MNSTSTVMGGRLRIPITWLKWGGWCFLISIFMSGFFFRFAPSTLSGSMQQELSLTATTLGIVASMHFWIYTLMQVPAGIFTDSVGIQKGGVIGGTVTAIGAFSFGFAPNLVVLLVGSALLGLGLSAVFVALMSYNATWFSPERHSLVMGTTMLLAALGSVIAQTPTAYLLHWFNWREVVLFFAALTLLATACLLIFCKDDPAPKRIRDSKAKTTVHPILRGNRYVLRERQVWLLFVCVAATNGTLYAFLGLWAVPLLTDGFSIQPAQAAQYATVALTMYGLSSLFWGWIADRIGAKKPIIVVTAMLSVAVWALMAFAEWEPGGVAMALFVLLGLSGGPVGVIFAATKESVALANVGFATALVNMGAFLTAALVQSGFGIILDTVSAADPETVPSLQSYQLALILPLTISGLGVVASLLLKERSLANEMLNE
ncbi:MFS transporter [Halomonas sp. IOP_14]|uniref:MFS transporter n=1 Tax=Halomonas sp. IOP_14 TaxID=2873295 RepID=UPI001E53232F|nr:MFS transporter [Halomonas sp. IOP_14]MCD1589063.1 MFS transporter [Halomonas sp. IOP_14]